VQLFSLNILKTIDYKAAIAHKAISVDGQDKDMTAVDFGSFSER